MTKETVASFTIHVYPSHLYIIYLWNKIMDIWCTYKLFIYFFFYIDSGFFYFFYYRVTENAVFGVVPLTNKFHNFLTLEYLNVTTTNMSRQEGGIDIPLVNPVTASRE